MSIEELKDNLRYLADGFLSDAAEIVADTATGYFQDSFSKKAFDGNPWAPGRPKKRGSLLIDSGALLNSIRTLEVTPEHVVIAAGNEKVPYARVHNEGFHGTVKVPEHSRHTKHGDCAVREHTRTANIVKRQFMGNSGELNAEIKKRLQEHLKDKLR